MADKKISQLTPATALVTDEIPVNQGGGTMKITVQGILDLTSAGSSPLTTKGDVFVFSTTNDRLPVGTDGQYLRADGTQVTGLKWNTAADLSVGNSLQFTGGDGLATVFEALTIDTIQDIRTTATPTFYGLTLDGAETFFMSAFSTQGGVLINDIANTGAVIPTSDTIGYILTAQGIGVQPYFAPPEELTVGNDTNVTLTLGGTPTAALLKATSITAGWQGTLSAARGGTGVGTLGDITRANDTNVTLTLGGTPVGAVITSTSFTLGWTGTLAAARLNSNVVQGITNDTNVTGSIAAQVLTLGWTGTLAAARLNANVVQAVTNDTNVTGSIATQTLTLGWTGNLSVARGGTGSGTANGALNNLLPTQTGNSGKFLTTNGTDSSWGTASASFDNPSVNVTLSVQNGSASTAMRSDAAPALSQAISPTWTALHVFATAARSSGVAKYLSIITPADTGMTASTESIGIQFGGTNAATPVTVTRTWAAGALTTQREYVFTHPTYNFASASTLTTAATVSITNAPQPGGNATITNPFALLVEAGYSRFVDGASIGANYTAPSSTLLLRVQKNQSAVTAIQIENTTNNASSNTQLILKNGSSATAYFSLNENTTSATLNAGSGLSLDINAGSVGGEKLTLSTRGTNRITITDIFTNSNAVGIGTTAPKATLHIKLGYQGAGGTSYTQAANDLQLFGGDAGVAADTAGLLAWGTNSNTVFFKFGTINGTGGAVEKFYFREDGEFRNLGSMQVGSSSAPSATLSIAGNKMLVDSNGRVTKYNNATPTNKKFIMGDGTQWVETTPTFPGDASATNKKIIKSDGTNWVASTETYDAPGTSGNLMKSDGTNWVSAAFNLATVDLTAQTATIGATTLYAVPASGQGVYMIIWTATVTTAATTSSTLGGTNGFQVTYTNQDDSTVITTPRHDAPSAGNNRAYGGSKNQANTVGTSVSGVTVVYAKASTNIQYGFEYTSSGATAMQYSLHIRIIKIA